LSSRKKEVVMKRVILVSALALALLVTFIPLSNAEMAKEGSGAGTTYYVVSWKPVLMHGQERVQIDYQAIGIHEADDESSILYHTTTNCVGAVNGVKGVYKEMGLCTATRPDGDQIYLSYETTGEVGKGAKGTYKFVGGTGKCEGITGTGEFTRMNLRPPTKKHHASIAKHKYNWKIP
jgi:hypothetical protein